MIVAPESMVILLLAFSVRLFELDQSKIGVITSIHPLGPTRDDAVSTMTLVQPSWI